MNRSAYDTDVTLWSPQGRLFQVEYAIEAQKQGSASIGLASREFVVLAGLKRRASELAAYQKKVFKIDNHLGIAISGLTADGRSLSKFMRTECLNHKYVFGSDLQASRLVENVADKHQEATQSYVRRPFGVGLLVAGYDATGAHLFETSPSGDYRAWHAMAIGSRSQSAKTYLEKHFESFEHASLDELIQHALKALQGCLDQGTELTPDNVTLAWVGKDTSFTIADGDAVAPHLQQFQAAGNDTRASQSGQGGAEEGVADADMEGDVTGDILM
jgi:20S proteasome subunit alpha 6